MSYAQHTKRLMVFTVCGAALALTIAGSTPASFRARDQGLFVSSESLLGRSGVRVPDERALGAGSATVGVPFGPNELAPTAYGRPYTGSKIGLIPSRAVAELRAARSAGMRVIVKLVGSQKNYRNEDGSFSLFKWKLLIERFRGLPLGKFIANRTIVAHQIVSEPKSRNQWGGTVITNKVLDEMARYSKSIWPKMATVVREDASDLERAGGRGVPRRSWVWTHLDAASSRYLADKGDVNAYARKEQASADRQGLVLVTGLNALAGGDGSSGIPSPTKSGAWTMSEGELLRYVPALLWHSRSCAFEIWRYASDPTYFQRAGILAAMVALAADARAYPSYPCLGGP